MLYASGVGTSPLDFPTGVAVGDRVFYVTNHGTSPGVGEVLRFRR